MENVNVVAEARQLNVKVEKEPDGTFVAVLPGPGDEEQVLPGATQEEAILEARAFRAIEASELYRVQYDDKKNAYVVTFAEGAPVKGRFADVLLHKAYAQAQQRYVDALKQVEPPPVAEEPAKPNGTTRKRRAKAEPEPEPTQQPAGEQITSGPQLKLEAAYARLERALQGVSDALEQMGKTFADMAIKLKERK